MNPLVAILITVGRILIAMGRWLLDWGLLAGRVRMILTNDLPHLQEQQQKTHDLVLGQINFCRGRLSRTNAEVPKHEGMTNSE